LKSVSQILEITFLRENVFISVFVLYHEQPFLLCVQIINKLAEVAVMFDWICRFALSRFEFFHCHKISCFPIIFSSVVLYCAMNTLSRCVKKRWKSTLSWLWFVIEFVSF